jgi:hypothetical protein
MSKLFDVVGIDFEWSFKVRGGNARPLPLFVGERLDAWPRSLTMYLARIRSTMNTLSRPESCVGKKESQPF